MPNVRADNDPWLSNDDGLGLSVDFSNKGQEDFLTQVANSANEEEAETPGAVNGEPKWDEVLPQSGELSPEIVTNVEELGGQPAAAAPAAAPAPEVVEPQEYSYEDGSSVVVEKTSKGWKATLDSGVRGAKKEVFYGKDKDELFANVAVGKINATRKIREMSAARRQAAPAQPVAPAPAAAPAAEARELTADEQFQLKNMFADNPGAAIDHFLKLRTGHTSAELAQIAREGREQGRAARLEVDTESVARAFIANNQEYYADPESQNYETVLAWICRYKLRTPYLGIDAAMESIVNGGLFTTEILQEAYDALSEDGLLLEKPAEEEEIPAAAPARPAAPAAEPAPNSRIAGTRTGKRAAPANYGLHNRDASAVPAIPDAQRAPSDEELEELSNGEIEKLFHGVVRLNARQKARRN